MAKVISFINYKGGVGKTTTTFHVGCGLAMFERKKVLLVDADPQTNLTFLCVNFEAWKMQIDKTGSLESIYSAYLSGTERSLPDFIWKSPMENPKLRNVDLVPSTIELLDIDLRLQSRTQPASTIHEVAKTHIEQRSILSNAIKSVAVEYDYILIDCPPNLYLATQNALYASDGYLVTMMPEHFSTVGLKFLDRKIQQLVRERNLSSQIIDPNLTSTFQLDYALCFVRVNMTAGNLHRNANEHMQAIKTSPQFTGRCFENYTEDRNDIREAMKTQSPVFVRNIHSHNALRYKKIVDEFDKRFSVT